MNAHAVLVEERHRRPIMSSFHGLFSLGGLVGAVLAAGTGGGSAAGRAPGALFAEILRRIDQLRGPRVPAT